MVESEIEDIYDPNVYRTRIERDFVLTLQVPSFRSNKKWSERMRETFLSQGKQWNDRVKSVVKAAVAEEVIASHLHALSAHKRGSFDGLVSALTVRLSSLRQ
jgi:GMP synthase PP-ATPase subunit